MMTTVLQSSNFFAIIVTIVIYFTPQKYRYAFDSLIIFLLLLGESILIILFGLFRNIQMKINDMYISISFYIFVFFLGAINCVGNVVYFPFLQNYRYSIFDF
jgi:hypothetical protein